MVTTETENRNWGWGKIAAWDLNRSGQLSKNFSADCRVRGVVHIWCFPPSGLSVRQGTGRPKNPH